MAITFISFWGLTVITMFFLKYYDRLTTRAAVHPSLPASMVSQIDPEPVACCKQNGAECGGITIAAMVTWWHRHTSSYSIWLDDYEIGCFSESCSSKQLDLHGLIRFLECYWCPKYQNIPCWGIDTCSHDPLNFLHSNSILPGSTTMTCLQKSSSLQPIATPPLTVSIFFHRWSDFHSLKSTHWDRSIWLKDRMCSNHRAVWGAGALPLCKGPERFDFLSSSVFPNALESQACQD